MPTATGPTATSTKTRRIVIDYTPAHEQRGGIGRYVRELCAALSRIDSEGDYRLFVAGAGRASLPDPPGANFQWKPARVSPRALARLWHRARLPLPIECWTGRAELFHATDFTLAPTLPAARTLLTVHDLSFARAPESASPALKAYLDKAVPRSAARADRILADSEATKADLIALYRIPPDKITVLYCGVDQRFRPDLPRAQIEKTREKYGLAGVDYLLSVGAPHPRKNYSRVIRAMSRARMRGLNLHYAIAGGSGWLEAEIRETIQNEGLSETASLLGFVDDADLPALYSGAVALLMPSLYEGFGLPVLEAMACGAPVISSDVSSLPEVAGDAALLVDPLDVDAISQAIERVGRDEAGRARMIEAGFRQARRFTWARAANQLRSIYDSMLET